MRYNIGIFIFLQLIMPFLSVAQSLIEKEINVLDDKDNNVIFYFARISDSSGVADISKFRLIKNKGNIPFCTIENHNTKIVDIKYHNMKSYSSEVYNDFEYIYDESINTYICFFTYKTQINNVFRRYYLALKENNWIVFKVQNRFLTESDLINNIKLDSSFFKTKVDIVPIGQLYMRDIISDIGYNGLFGRIINSELSIDDNIIIALKSYYQEIYGTEKNIRIKHLKDTKDYYSVVVFAEQDGTIDIDKFILDKYDLWINQLE